MQIRQAHLSSREEAPDTLKLYRNRNPSELSSKFGGEVRQRTRPQANPANGGMDTPLGASNGGDLGKIAFRRRYVRQYPLSLVKKAGTNNRFSTWGGSRAGHPERPAYLLEACYLAIVYERYRPVRKSRGHIPK